MAGPDFRKPRWWLTETVRCVQTNLRETDAGLDPERLIAQLRDLGANTILFNAGGIVAWYPTRIKYHRLNPYLRGDLLGELVECAHEAGVRVIGRLDLSKCPQPALDERPEWFYLSPKGERVDYNGQYHTCICGGYYREQGGAVLREILENYPLDSVFFNMFGFQTYDYSGNYHGICHCDGCREQFRAETGLELPASENAAGPGLAEYYAFRDRRVAATAQFMHDVVKEFGDHLAISTWMFHPAVEIIRMESNRSLHTGGREFHHLHGAWAVNRVRTTWDDRTINCCANHFFDIPYRFASEPAGLTAARIAGNLAQGGNLDFYVLGTLDQPDEEGFAPIREVYHHQEQHAGLYSDLRSLARVLLVEDRMHGEAFRGFYTALAHEHFPFDVLAAGELDRWAAEERLGRYCAVVLPDQPALPPETAAALDSYVEAGGRLLAAGRTGFEADGRSFAPGGCALASLGLGRVDGALKDSRATYCMLDGEDGLEALPQTRAFFVHGPFAQGEARDGARALYPVQRGLYGPPEKVQWWDDPADSPVSGEYGAFHVVHGRGETICFPFDLGALYWRYQESAHRALVGHWIRAFLDGGEGRPHVGVHGAPLGVQLSAHRVGDTGDVLVHLVNYTGCQRSHFEMPIPVSGIMLFGTGDPKRITALRAGVGPEIHRGPGDWSITVPELGLFEAILVEGML
jgi:hypothetical protein